MAEHQHEHGYDRGWFRYGFNTMPFISRTVHNGSKPKLTITLQSSPRDGSAAYAIVSKNSKRETHYWPAVIYEK